MIHYFVSVQLNLTRMPSRRCLVTGGNPSLAAGTNSSALSNSFNAVMKSLNGRASLRIFLKLPGGLRCPRPGYPFVHTNHLPGSP
jgi:hypothetical protein